MDVRIYDIIYRSGSPPSPSPHILPAVIFCLQAAADGRKLLPQDVLYGAAGLLFSNLWYDRDLKAIYDISSLPSNFIASIDRLFHMAGYDYEIARKWGGVYTREYFWRRIIEHLRLGLPSLLLPSSPENDVLCVTGADEQTGCLLAGRNAPPIHMDDCYERLDGIFLIGRPVSSHPATFTIDTLLQIARYSVTAAFFLINAVPHNPDPAVEELLFQHLFCDMDLSLAVLRRHARFLSVCRREAVNFLNRLLSVNQTSGNMRKLRKAICLYKQSYQCLGRLADARKATERYAVAIDLDHKEKEAIAIINEVVTNHDSH